MKRTIVLLTALLKLLSIIKLDLESLYGVIDQFPNYWKSSSNRLVSQMRATLVAYLEPAGKLWQLCKVLYVLEHKMQYILIHAPYTRIGVFWHISNIPPLIL